MDFGLGYVFSCFDLDVDHTAMSHLTLSVCRFSLLGWPRTTLGIYV